jgi:hypothetical protein
MRAMKTPRWLLWPVWLLIATWLPAADETPDEVPPPVPSDVQLRNGAVLHKVTVLRWEKSLVVLKHAGGADPIRYVDIADSQKAAIMARGQYEIAHPPIPRPPPPDAAAGKNVVIYKGQVTIPTVDPVTKVGAVYKFAGIAVYVFPLSALKAFDGEIDPVDLPKPIVRTTTDADGNFLLSVPADTPHFIFSEAERVVPSGRDYLAWRVESKDIKNPQDVQLGTHYRVHYRGLRIAE